MVINPEKIDESMYQELELAIQILCVIMESVMLFPGRLETWIVVIQAEDLSFVHFNNFEQYFDLTQVFQSFMTHFPNRLEAVYIIDAEQSFQIHRTSFEHLIPSITRQKIIEKDKSELKREFDQD